MSSATIGLIILCVISFFTCLSFELTRYFVSKLFKRADERKREKDKIQELEEKLRQKTDLEHKKVLNENADNLPFA